MDPRNTISPELCRIAALSGNVEQMKKALHRAADSLVYMAERKQDERADFKAYETQTEELRSDNRKMRDIINSSWGLKLRYWWQTRMIIQKLKKAGILVRIK